MSKASEAGRSLTLRSWLKRLADTDRLVVARPGVALKHELAAIGKD